MNEYKQPCPVDEMTVEQAKEYLKAINNKSVWDMTDEELGNQLVAEAVAEGASKEEIIQARALATGASLF